jgi:hypothetical protein
MSSVSTKRSDVLCKLHGNTQPMAQNLFQKVVTQVEVRQQRCNKEDYVLLPIYISPDRSGFPIKKWRAKNGSMEWNSSKAQTMLLDVEMTCMNEIFDFEEKTKINRVVFSQQQVPIDFASLQTFPASLNYNLVGMVIHF